MVRWILAACFIFSFTMGTSFILIPFTANLSGFWPDLIAIAISFIYLVLTGFYYLEAILAMPAGANVFSITKHYNGKGWASLSSLVLGLVVYSNLIYYIFLAGPIFKGMLASLHIHFSETTISILAGLIGAISIFLGLTFTMVFNFFLFLATALLFYFSFTPGFSQEYSLHFAELKWSFFLLSISSIVNTLYYHTLIPTIASFLNYSKKKTLSCIVVGYLAAISVFTLWVFFSITSAGKSFENYLSQVNPTNITYDDLIKIPFIGKWLPFLTGLCLITSILCNMAILVDFFADLFALPLAERKGRKRLMLAAAVFFPAVLLALIPSQTLFALELYITEIGGAFLSGLLPILWIWSLRYFYREQVEPLVFGGKTLLLGMTIFTIFIFYSIGLEIIYQTIF